MSQTYAYRITGDASNFRAAAEQTTQQLALMGTTADRTANALMSLGGRGGAEFGPLADGAARAGEAIGSLSMAIRATTLLSGIGALASAGMAVYEVFKNWGAITESIGRGLDYIAGRARVSAQSITGLEAALTGLAQYTESPDARVERQARDARERALQPVRDSLTPLRAEIQALEAERATLQGSRLRSILTQAGTTPAEDIDQIVALRERRNATRIAAIDAQIQERRGRVTSAEAQIATTPVVGLLSRPAGPDAPVVVAPPRETGGGGRATRELPQFGPGMNDYIASQRQIASETTRLYEQTRTPEEQRTARLERYNELLADGALDQDTYNRAVAALEPSAERATQSFGKLNSAISNALEDFITGTKTFGEAVKSLALDISKLVIRSTVTGPISSGVSSSLGSFGTQLAASLGGTGAAGGAGAGAGATGGSFDFAKIFSTLFSGAADGGVKAAAHGAIFGGAGVIPFASGGIVTRPTLFPFSRGTGLMGEAGPEAIVPLRRGRDGKLGVASDGGAQVTININSPDADGFRRSADQVTAAVADGVRRGGRLR